LEKSATDFGKICHRFCEAPFLGKTGSVFGKNMLLFWEKHAPCWEKHAPFLERTGSVFGKNKLRFLGQTGSVWWKIGLVFGSAWDKTQVSLF